MVEFEDAWAAGLFDGEGHVQLKRNKPGQKARVLLRLGMQDEYSVRRWGAWAGCRVHGPYDGMFYATVPAKLAEEVMERLRPFLGMVKWEDWYEKYSIAGPPANTGRKVA